MKSSHKSQNAYKALIEKIFLKRYRKGAVEIPFEREDLTRAAAELQIRLPKNLGDVLYSLRYRTEMPKKITATQPKGKEWVIEGTGRSRYAFKLAVVNRILPNAALLEIKIPDATPEIVSAYALSDEQALLAKIRHNRLIDIFLCVTTFSLQNHLRTTVKGIGQVEIDEIYVGLNKKGSHFIIPVQAKGGKDALSSVQTRQDFACCAEKFPLLICRSISAQFMENNLIALFELAVDGDSIKVMEERHYRLVPADEIGRDDLDRYRNQS